MQYCSCHSYLALLKISPVIEPPSPSHGRSTSLTINFTKFQNVTSWSAPQKVSTSNSTTCTPNPSWKQQNRSLKGRPPHESVAAATLSFLRGAPTEAKHQTPSVPPNQWNDRASHGSASARGTAEAKPHQLNTAESPTATQINWVTRLWQNDEHLAVKAKHKERGWKRATAMET